MSEGTLANIFSQCNDLADAPVEQFKALIQHAPVAHFDETGFRVCGKRWWLHAASTAKAVYYQAHGKRGVKAMDDIGILPDFVGRAIHDFWQPYLRYGCLHGLCNTHHLRELIFVHEQFERQDWADRMIDCLLAMKDAVDQAKPTRDPVPAKRLKALEKRYQKIMDAGYARNPLPPLDPNAKKKRGRRKKSKPRNLLERLDKHRQEVLAFLYDFAVPFDNNLSERDIRMMKLRQKISGTFRTVAGVEAFARIRSYIATVRKNAIGAMDALVMLFNGKAFVPPSTPHSQPVSRCGIPLPIPSHPNPVDPAPGRNRPE